MPNIERKTHPADVVRLGLEMQARGYKVWEHPDFGGVNPKYHIPNSKHTRGEAIDINYLGTYRAEDDRLDQLAVELERRLFGAIWNRGPSDHNRHCHGETIGDPEQYPGRVRLKRKNIWPLVRVDGRWGTKTTYALQRALQTPATGGMTQDGPSTVIEALQRFLVTEARDDDALAVDGILGPKTIEALQRYLGTKPTGKITRDGYSTVVGALQRQLNATGGLA